ncbi:PREDICTED: protein Wnt-3a [Dipodomys ordii]|uniref:Protein Wnt n=1 Tax=Dipodomys ordii TaxID=10020 RepID=A0A1S3F4K6_DIPOR|nr:PREDICTED: protein Wnt-3a [Dipodomys ordii]
MPGTSLPGKQLFLDRDFPLTPCYLCLTRSNASLQLSTSAALPDPHAASPWGRVLTPSQDDLRSPGSLPKLQRPVQVPGSGSDLEEAPAPDGYAELDIGAVCSESFTLIAVHPKRVPWTPGSSWGRCVLEGLPLCPATEAMAHRGLLTADGQRRQSWRQSCVARCRNQERDPRPPGIAKKNKCSLRLAFSTATVLSCQLGGWLSSCVEAQASRDLARRGRAPHHVAHWHIGRYGQVSPDPPPGLPGRPSHRATHAPDPAQPHPGPAVVVVSVLTRGKGGDHDSHRELKSGSWPERRGTLACEVNERHGPQRIGRGPRGSDCMSLQRGGTRHNSEETQGETLFCPRAALLGPHWSLAVGPQYSSLGTQPILCASIPGLVPKQLRFCRNYVEIMPSVAEGVKAGIQECQHQFRGRRWNCTTVSNSLAIFGPVLDKATRESAFVHAIASAGVAFAVTRSCAEGSAAICGCSSRHQGSPGEGWKWGGCGEDIEFGGMVSREFADARENRPDARSAMNRHNNEAGRQARARGTKARPEHVARRPGPSTWHEGQARARDTKARPTEAAPDPALQPTP